jgi:hypothetical protein
VKPITDDELKRLEELEAKATKGPWKYHDDDGVAWNDPLACGYDSKAADRGSPYFCTGPRAMTEEQADADERLLVAIRNATPALLQTLRRYKEAFELAMDWANRSPAGHSSPDYEADMAKIRELTEGE